MISLKDVFCCAVFCLINNFDASEECMGLHEGWDSIKFDSIHEPNRFVSESDQLIFYLLHHFT
jgi:hypothetical protein